MFLLEPGRAESLVYSASDLVLAGECEFRLLRRLDELLGRTPRREREEDEMLARTAALGDEHESRVLTAFQSRYGVSRFQDVVDGTSNGGVVSVPTTRHMSHDELAAAHERTLAALEHGADVVYQASFFDGKFHGRADFLVRDVGLGALRGDRTDPRYAVYDTKLARRAKVRALLQLAAYADQLIAARIDPTEQVHLILGDRSETHHDLGDVLPVFQQRRERLLRVLEEHVSDDAPVAWGDDRWLGCGRLGVCPDCAEAAAAARDVLLVKGVYERQRLRLTEGGISTIDALAAAAEPPEGMAAARFEGLQEQARLQLGLDEGHGWVALDGEPESPSAPASGPEDSDDEPGVPAQESRLRWKIVDPGPVDRLPAPSPGDIFFDFEGDPLWEEPRAGLADGRAEIGLDYLFGWVDRPTSGELPRFTGLWADDLAAERDALVQFVDQVNARLAEYPEMHVYHYASYEKTHLLSIAARHGTYEDEVDELLRRGVLVDLYAVVRSALRTSDRSLSIKKLEPLYMQDDPSREGVVSAAASVIEYAEYVQAVVEERVDDAAVLQRRIREYNEYDCRSTWKLLEWLRWAREQVRGGPGAGQESREEVSAEEGAPAGGDLPGGPRREERERRAALARDVREVVGESSGVRSRSEEALALLGAAVEYYVREDKPFWQEHFARLELPVDEWPRGGSAFVVGGGQVMRDWEVEPGKRTPSREVELAGEMLDRSRVRDSELAAGSGVQVLYDHPVPPVVGEVGERAVRGAHGGGEVIAVRNGATDPGGPGASRAADDDAARTGPSANSDKPAAADVVVLRERVRQGVAEHVQLPVAIAPGAGPGHNPQEDAVEEAVVAALEKWRADRCLPRGPAVDILERRQPRLVGGGDLPRPGPDMVETVDRAVRSLDRSYLAVQGPPGTGKTHVGSHVLARLVADGWRVGVVSQSHAAVENMLRAAVDKAGVPVEIVAKKHDGRARVRPAVSSTVGADTAEAGTTEAGAGAVRQRPAPPWEELSAGQLAGFAEASRAGCVVGGTAWDFAHSRWPREFLDLLVIDEAGQFSLADTIAVARSAERLLLLGDPQQLPQVTQGRHPEPVDTSALSWLTGTEPVLPESLGYFLDSSWRMHPALCRKVSDLAYSGRLGAHPLAAERTLDGIEPGVVHVPVPHEGNRTASSEEAAEVVRQVHAVIGREWSDGGQSRQLGERDVVVVAAYNAQVHTVRRALAETGLDGVPVGTVDLFQGREAPVAILTLAASSPQDVSRGMGFLLSRNRLNVAISRAQWRAVVVRSPRLTDYLPGDLEADGVRHLEDLGAFLRLTNG